MASFRAFEHSNVAGETKVDRKGVERVKKERSKDIFVIVDSNEVEVDVAAVSAIE